MAARTPQPRPIPGGPAAASAAAPAAAREAAWESLEAGALVLAANAGLAASLIREYDRRQVEAGRRAWNSPQILSLPAWLAQTHARFGSRLLLTPAQEQELWAQVVRPPGASAETRRLDRHRIAAAAARSWRLLQDWRLPWRDAGLREQWRQSEGPERFLGWAQEMSALCREHAFLTAAELPEAVIARVASGAVPLPERIWLAGFDEPSPRQQDLFASLRRTAARVEAWPASAHASTPRFWAAPDPESELRMAANWARLRAAPGRRIGVVVPELGRLRPMVERVFTETFGAERTPWEDSAADFHISLGVPLAERPILAAAFDLLGCDPARPQELGFAGGLVLSPFLDGAVSERQARARWRRGWADQHWAVLPPQALTGHRAHEHCPRLVAAMRQLARARAHWPRRQGAREWAAAFAEALEAAGWPGEAALSSSEFRAAQAWNDLLDEWSQLDLLPATGQAPGWTAAAALATLRRLAAQHLFQPESAGEITRTRVEVLGWLEVAGREFDELWITGLHDGILPAPAAPDPFLPLAMQRSYQMPHAVAEREMQYAQGLWERLRTAAAVVVASFPQRGNGTTLSRSPLLQQLSPTQELGDPDMIEPGLAAAVQGARPAAAAMERLEDFRAPAADSAEATGGTVILREQAACAFQAFAHRRLRALDGDRAPAGLSSLTRGNLLHAFLRSVWEKLQSRTALAALTADAKSTLLAECARAAVEQEDLLHNRPALQQLEADRLVRQGLAWLEVESARPTDFTVQLLEQERDVSFAGLECRLRPDRVDALDGVGLAILDYKSGETSKGDWTLPRPNEPQLPLYWVTSPQADRIAAIAFAQAKPGEMSLKAMARGKNLFPGHALVPADWRQTRLDFEAELTRLAGEYLEGHAAVAPKTRQTCERCDLALFCRIREAEADADGESDGEDSQE